MKHAIDAIYENGAFRPLKPDVVAIPDGQRVRITIDDQSEPEALRLAAAVYDGLSQTDIEEIEQIAVDRGRFFAAGSGD
jgi:predicted DNA-binding antitoxin AbrB/MazE fold protein